MLERLLSKIIDVEVCRNMGGGADVPTHVLLIRIFKTFVLFLVLVGKLSAFHH